MKRKLRMPKTKKKEPQTTMAIPTGTEIRKARENRSLSVRELASKASVSYQAILRWENGKGTPQPKTVRKVITALNDIPELPTLKSEETKG